MTCFVTHLECANCLERYDAGLVHGLCVKCQRPLWVISLEGLSICPEAAVCLAALESLLARGDVRPDERIVIFNTGAAQKYPEAVCEVIPLIDIRQPVEWSRI